MSGFPPSKRLFFLGSRLEPPRAGISANIRNELVIALEIALILLDHFHHSFLDETGTP